MRKFFAVITSVILLSSCKQTDTKNVQNKETTKKDSAKVESSSQTAQSNSDLLEQFSKNKNEIHYPIKKLETHYTKSTLKKTILCWDR